MAAGDYFVNEKGIQTFVDNAKAAFPINWKADTIGAMLVAPGTWTPNVVTDEFISDGGPNDPASNEPSGGGYVRQTLGTKSIEQASNKIRMKAADVTFSSINVGQVAYLVIFKDTGNDLTSPIIVSFDLGPVTTNGGDLIGRFGTDGVFSFNPNP